MTSVDRHRNSTADRQLHCRNKTWTSIVIFGIIVSLPSCTTSYLMTQPIKGCYHLINVTPKHSSTKEYLSPNFRCLPLAVLTAPDKLEEAILSAISEYDEVNSIEEKNTHPKIKLTSTELIPTFSTARGRRKNGRQSTSGDGVYRPTFSPLPKVTNLSSKQKTNFLENEISDVKISSRKTSSGFTISSGRSSTMPGFMDRNKSGRHESFKDGLNIARKANTTMKGNKIKKILTSKKAVRKRTKANSEAMYASSASVPDSMISFTNQLHQVSRITPLEEKELGTQTQDSIRIQQLYDKLENEFNREPTDAEWCAAAGRINIEAIQQVIDDGHLAKQRLVMSNLRMVQGVVNLYIRNGLGSEFNAGDLMQEGTMALIRAAEKFQPELGFRFSTYAMYWIRSSVKRSHTLQSRIIQVPQRLHETHKKVLKYQQSLEDDLGRPPTSCELAEAVGISELQLERCLDAMAQQCFSLDASIENTLKPNSGDVRGNDSRYDLIDSKYGNIEKGLKSEAMKRDLVDTLRTYLSVEDADLILMRYGLLDEDRYERKFTGPLTIAELSKIVGLKPDKVRRTINKSLKELHNMMSTEWKHYEKDLSML